MRFNVKLILVFFMFLILGMSFYRYDPETGQWIKLEEGNEYGEVSLIGNSVSGYCNKWSWEVKVSSRVAVEIPPEFSFTKTAVPVTPNIETLPDGNFRVPLKEYAEWNLTIQLTSSDVLNNVVIKDNFPGDLGVGNPPIFVSHGIVKYKYSGESKKVSIEWIIGDNFSGTATLILKIYTDKNPGGNQEYTSAGPHPLNEEVTLTYSIGNKVISETFLIEIKVIAYEKNREKKKK